MDLPVIYVKCSLHTLKNENIIFLGYCGYDIFWSTIEDIGKRLFPDREEHAESLHFFICYVFCVLYSFFYIYFSNIYVCQLHLNGVLVLACRSAGFDPGKHARYLK